MRAESGPGGGFPVPGQQLVHAGVRQRRDAPEHVGDRGGGELERGRRRHLRARRDDRGARLTFGAKVAM